MADDHINYVSSYTFCRQSAIRASLYTNTLSIIRGSVEHEGCVPDGGSFKSRTSLATRTNEQTNVGSLQSKLPFTQIHMVLLGALLNMKAVFRMGSIQHDG